MPRKILKETKQAIFRCFQKLTEKNGNVLTKTDIINSVSEIFSVSMFTNESYNLVYAMYSM
jgi:hypothetical protein